VRQEADNGNLGCKPERGIKKKIFIIFIAERATTLTEAADLPYAESDAKRRDRREIACAEALPLIKPVDPPCHK
jgi:hypothetical protein